MGRASRAKAAHRDTGGITVRLARPGEGMAVQRLYELIDMSPGEQAKTGPVASVIDRGLTRPAELGTEFHYVAIDRSGQVVGSASASTPVEWTMSFGDDLNSALRKSLIEVTRLAVDPDARGRGIGRRLLGAVELEAARRGVGLAETTYKRDAKARLGAYYQAAGFTELDPSEPLRILHGRAVLTLPYDAASSIAIKPLRRGVTITSPPGGSTPDLPRLVRGLVDLPSQVSPGTAPAADAR